ncbi:CENPQ protein, partial [Eudromia elegans]|nr:CENPQ protein [Eudromia elegans]
TKENGSSKEMKLSSAEKASWQTLSESSKQFLETMMNSIILSLLCQQRERKEDVQKHFNLLKQRMLRFFKTLKVPPRKLGNLKNLLSLQVGEKQMLETNEESLVQLQEEINEAKRSAERIDETVQQLQYKIQVLKNQLEENEKKASKNEILKIKNKKGLLKDVGIIQQSAEMKNMLTLIEKIYEKVDFI